MFWRPALEAARGPKPKFSHKFQHIQEPALKAAGCPPEKKKFH